tara:strand:+ start:567 stop:1106 length:540 start_codon:yes stop_codon:yes gene_type:complete
LLSIDLFGATVISTRLEVTMQDFVLVEPLGLENFVMSDLVGIIVTEIRKNEISLGVWMGEAVLVLPLVLVHSQGKLLGSTDFFHGLNMSKTILLLFVEESVKFINLVIVVLEESAALQFLNSGRIWISKVDVVFLLVSGVLEDLIWTEVVWELAKSVVVTSSEAPLDEVSFLVGIVVKH